MEKVKNLISSAAAGTSAFLLSAGSVLAAAEDKINLGPKGEFGPLKDLTAGSIISGLVRLSLVVAAIVFFFVLVIGGIRWIMSGGDKQATEASRSQITAALVGLVIVFAAWAIIQLIDTLFGVSILELNIPSFEP